MEVFFFFFFLPTFWENTINILASKFRNSIVFFFRAITEEELIDYNYFSDENERRLIFVISRVFEKFVSEMATEFQCRRYNSNRKQFVRQSSV